MRIKRGLNKRRSHKAVLQLTKGYRTSYHKLYRRAREAVLHAGQYSFYHRRHRAAQMRRDWIKIIASGLYGTNLSYSKFVNALHKNNIEIDRKVLAEIAQTNPAHFTKLVDTLK